MNRNRIAAILIVCAVVLAAGAYFLVANQSEDHSSLRQEVTPPDEKPEPPAWVAKEQKTEPDYSSAEAEPKKAEPVETESEQQTQPSVIEVKEDKVVTFGFINSLVDYTLSTFVPQDKYGRPASRLSARGLNIHFGVNMEGFKANGNDIGSARQFVLDYAFSPKMIEHLYNSYSQLYVEQLVEIAANDPREYEMEGSKEHRTLEDAEIAAMLRLNSLRMTQAASVFNAIATDPEIVGMAGQYLQASKNVDRVNQQLQTILADGVKPTNEGQRLKQAIMQREQIKKDIISRLQGTCPGCTTQDLFYLARWSYRRTLGKANRLSTFDTVSTVLDDLSKRFQIKATELDQ